MRLQFHNRLGLAGWLAILIALVLLAAIAAIAVSVFIVVLPIVLLMAVFFYFFPRKRRRSGYRRAREPEVIDGNFRVLDPQSQRETSRDRTGSTGP